MLQKQALGKYWALVFLCSMLLKDCKLDSNWNCFGASTPVDLKIENPFDKSIKVVFFEYTKSNGYKKIGVIQLKANEQKSICFETEGAIERNGLYIISRETVYKIKLSPTTENTFDFKNESTQIRMNNDLVKKYH